MASLVSVLEVNLVLESATIQHYGMIHLHSVCGRVYIPQEILGYPTCWTMVLPLRLQLVEVDFLWVCVFFTSYGIPIKATPRVITCRTISMPYIFRIMLKNSLCPLRQCCSITFVFAQYQAIKILKGIDTWNWKSSLTTNPPSICEFFYLD